jgi:hypothetical protein
VSTAKYERAVHVAVLTHEFECWACHHHGPHRAISGEAVAFECSACGIALDERDVRRAVAQAFAPHGSDTEPELPVNDTIPPAPPLPVIPRGEAVASVKAALADLRRMVDMVEATAIGVARALDV